VSIVLKALTIDRTNYLCQVIVLQPVHTGKTTDCISKASKKFKWYQPKEVLPTSTPTGCDKGKRISVRGGQRVQVSENPSHYPEELRAETELSQDAVCILFYNFDPPSLGMQQSLEPPLQGRGSKRSHYSQIPITLTYDEALLFKHFIVHLVRWLDCTDASCRFATLVPEKAMKCPLLCHAVLCFAGRHRREDKIAEMAYQRCITMLIDRLDTGSISYDETLPLAVLILHFADQLEGELPACPSA
jgi:hypothetical protein